MRELSLFTGAGGGLLGTKLLGWRPIGYVEKDEYCQRVIAARIRDGYLEEAPIFGDIRAFNRDGYAESYQGMVDVVTAGFPCQPFSCAGKRRGADDDRNMWPETMRCIRTVRPRYAFLENVPGLISSGYFATVLGDLAESGYDARWRILSAAEVGAPHRRDRLWVVAESSGTGARGEHRPVEADRGGRARWNEPAHRQGNGESGADRINSTGSSAGDKAHADEFRWERGRKARNRGDRSKNKGGIRNPCVWPPEPALGRVANGVADRVGQLRVLGNGQVPLVVATVWRLLTEDLS